MATAARRAAKKNSAIAPSVLTDDPASFALPDSVADITRGIPMGKFNALYLHVEHNHYDQRQDRRVNAETAVVANDTAAVSETTQTRGTGMADGKRTKQVLDLSGNAKLKDTVAEDAEQRIKAGDNVSAEGTHAIGERARAMVPWHRRPKAVVTVVSLVVVSGGLFYWIFRWLHG